MFLNRRTAKANLRNHHYPTNVPIIGVQNDKFRIFEVVADGRCLFGTMWLLIQEPSVINRLLSEKNDYKEIEDFNDNGGLNQFIKSLFASLTKCQKIKMMAQYFLNHEFETSQISNVIGLYDTDNPLIIKHCSSDSQENTKMVNTWYERLGTSGVVKKFDDYLLSLHTNQTPYEDYEESYRYSDIELFGNVLSDIYLKNINLVKSTEGIYKGDYKVFMKYTGIPNRIKEDIYIYYKADNHFQPMIPNSILDISNRGGPSSSAAVSSSKTFDELNTKFSQFDASTISQVFEANNQDIVRTNNRLQEMTDGSGHDESSGVQSNEKPLRAEEANCPAEKKFLSDYFTFPKKLKIKYVSPNNDVPTDLPSTGIFGSIKVSTTNRIKAEERNTDNVYSKVSKIFTNPRIEKVEIFDSADRIQTPETFKNAKEEWYFLVTLEIDPVKGGRTRKRHPKRARVRSQKKRKMRILKRRTKRPRRFSQTKRQKQ